MTRLFARLRALPKRPSAAELAAALREAFLTTLALYAVPGLALGLPLGRGEVGTVGLAGSIVLGTVLAGVAFFLANRTWRDEQDPRGGAIRASIQAASSPAVPLLLALATWRDPAALLSLLALAAAAFLFVWRALPRWAAPR